jgi:PTS system nitrogen regulatory IIA component
MDALVVFDVLWERERLGTTGVGHGIAIPHGRVAGIDKVSGFFARLSQPVNFESIDDKPVDLVFLLLAPEAAGADHLHALATVSRLLRDPKLCEQLRSAPDATTLYTLLTENQAAQAA